MSIFPTAAEMRAIAGPIVADAAEQLGSRADIHAIQSIRQRDGSYKKGPVLSAPAVPVRLTMLTSEQAQEIFGLDAHVEFKGSMVRSVAVESKNVFEVVSGPFSGQWLIVEKLIENDLSDSYTLGLVTTGALK